MEKASLVSQLETQYDTTQKPKKFIIGHILPLTGHNHADGMVPFFDAIMRMGYKVLVGGHGDQQYKKRLFDLEARDSKKCTMVDESEQDEKIWKKVDAMIFGVAPTADMLRKCAENGVVPIVPAGGVVNDFDPTKESGEGFTFVPQNFWSMIDAFVRAAENRKFSYDWGNIKKALKKRV